MWEIQKLSSAHDRTPFDCGEPDLDQWLKTVARQSDNRRETLTTVAVESGATQVLGYYSTRSYSLEGAELARAFGPDARYPMPCLLLARLARCRSVRGQGMGEFLMANALASAARVAENTGLKFVVVHAIDEKAAQFYEQYGFVRFVDHEHHLLLPVKDVVAAMKS